jgi:osmotically inducible protein OsmC
MAADRTASATWKGNLTEGSGRIHSFGSGALGELPVTWAARSQESNGQTSPEELIAAAHASCFSMAFANMLFKKGFTAEQLDTTATVTFVPGTGITTSHLVTHGRVPGATEEEFLATAEEARAGCPVSQALAGVAITLDASFDA